MWKSVGAFTRVTSQARDLPRCHGIDVSSTTSVRLAEIDCRTFSPTAMRMVSSSKRRPHDEVGLACSQSPQWEALSAASRSLEVITRVVPEWFYRWSCYFNFVFKLYSFTFDSEG